MSAEAPTSRELQQARAMLEGLRAVHSAPSMIVRLGGDEETARKARDGIQALDELEEEVQRLRRLSDSTDKLWDLIAEFEDEEGFAQVIGEHLQLELEPALEALGRGPARYRGQG